MKRNRTDSLPAKHSCFYSSTLTVTLMFVLAQLFAKKWATAMQRKDPADNTADGRGTSANSFAGHPTASGYLREPYRIILLFYFYSFHLIASSIVVIRTGIDKSD